MYRIGCDVGGTNTDAALLDTSRIASTSKGILAIYKTPTTKNVTDGIRTAIESVLVQSQIDRREVFNVAIGTTHFVNAVVEKDPSRLQKVAVVRLCGPYTRSNPPFSDFPYALRDVVEGPHFFLDGGLEIDGREIKPLNCQQIVDTAKEIVARGIQAVAIVGVFSALDHEGIHEDTCKKIMLDAYPSLHIVTSHSIGGPGLLARENATILNAAILRFAMHTIHGFQQAMQELHLDCVLFLTQNDGTLIDAEAAAQLPIKTFASGPTNSLVGASFLRGQDTITQEDERQILVVDIGGTTSDICALLPTGFPRKAANFVEIGGVRTAFSMPEVYSIGLGGGSRVRVDESDRVTIGPDSVGYNLQQEAMVFGGSTLTATDIMVAAGVANVGDAQRVSSVPKHIVKAAVAEIRHMLEKAIDRMKVSPSPATVLLVGGGSIIFPEDMSMEHIEPEHHDSANAVGAAIAKISGEIDVIEVMLEKDEEAIVGNARQKAISLAVARGADPSAVEISELNRIPLQYVSNKATRLVVKAVGTLNSSPRSTKKVKAAKSIHIQALPINKDGLKPDPSTIATSPQSGSMARPCTDINLSEYRPNVRGGVWYISAIDVELCAIGCGVLGTGGGGSPYNMALHVLDVLRQKGNRSITVIALEALKDDDICVFGSGYGAPSVSDERVSSGEEIPSAIEELNKILGITDFQGLVANEIGGGNGIVTFPTSAKFGRPVVDCDLMGRAYPTVEHCTPYVYGHPVLPVAMADAKGNVSVVVKAENNTKLEGMLRTTCIELGNAVGVTGKPLSGKVIKQCAIPNTLSQAWYIGRAVHLARQQKVDVIAAIDEVVPIKLLFEGKIINVTRDVSRGYTIGTCIVAPMVSEGKETSDNTAMESRQLVITFQNEYLIAYHADMTGKKDVLCVVPDLISILGTDGEALGSPDLRYGLEVRIIAMPAHPLWTQDAEALRIGGPEFFRLDVPWTPVAGYRKSKSVIEEYNSAT